MHYVKNKTSDRVENYRSLSVVKVVCGRNMGTAVCVFTFDSAGHLFLTCAHVVQYKTQSVLLHYDGYVIRGKVIYTTHKHDTNDIAVIVSEQHKVNIIPCEISNNITSIGQKVFAVGYTCVNNVPAVVFGRIQRTSFTTITTNCNVRIGFSGGPVFTSDGQLVGLTTGKLSLGTVHFVLPSTEFIEPIKKYIVTNDVNVLNNLESKLPLKKMYWHKGLYDKNLMCHI